MKPLYRNVFLAIGVVAIIIMLCTSDLSYSELWDNVRRAGYWFPAVILLWVFLYLANAWSWSVIIHDGAAPKVPFLKIYKYTISGYALNYVTPRRRALPYYRTDTVRRGGQGDIQRDSVCHDAHLFPFLFLDFLHPPLLVALWPGNVGRNGGVHARLFRLLRYGHLLFPERI